MTDFNIISSFVAVAMSDNVNAAGTVARVMNFTKASAIFVTARGLYGCLEQ